MTFRADVAPSTLGVELNDDGVVVEYIDGRKVFYHGPPEAVEGSVRAPPGKLTQVLVTVGMGRDDMRLRSEESLDVRRVAEGVESTVPEAGVEVVGGREGHLEYLAGERDAVLDAVVSAIAKTYKPA